MPPPEPVLICALSGRALAQAARAAGYAPIVLDAFGDLDTREAATAWLRVPVGRRWAFRRRPLLAAAARLAPPPIPLVWGSGFERAPDLLDALAAGRRLWGNHSSLVRTAKDPWRFADLARSLGLSHPELRSTVPHPRSGWLSKRAGAAGGGHVRPAVRGRLRGRGWYWQRRVEGTPHSALVVGNGRDARTLALARQLLSPRPGRPYRFGGIVAPAALPQSVERRAALDAALLAAALGVRGLVSVDLLVHGDQVSVLELNPRPGASLDAHRRALPIDLFATHVAACGGGMLPTPPAAGSAWGSLIVHAAYASVVPLGFTWPDWAADRSPPGTRIGTGGPICTVLAQGADGTDVERRLRARAERIQAALRVTRPMALCQEPG
ncbi:MAG: ATP-grasp domain-containing protein [Geminicoccaceae bacterium]